MIRTRGGACFDHEPSICSNPARGAADGLAQLLAATEDGELEATAGERAYLRGAVDALRVAGTPAAPPMYREEP